MGRTEVRKKEAAAIFYAAGQEATFLCCDRVRGKKERGVKMMTMTMMMMIILSDPNSRTTVSISAGVITKGITRFPMVSPEKR